MLFSILPTLPLLTVLSAFFFLPFLDGKRLTPLTKDSIEKFKWGKKKKKLVTLLKINTIKL